MALLLEKYFCFELLTTGLIIGWLGLAESLVSSVTGIVMLENIDTYFDPAKYPDIDVKTARALFVNLIGTAIALNILNVLACGLLIIGTVKRNHLLVIPWLVKNALSLATLCLLQCILVVLLFTSKDTAVVFGIIALVIVVLCFYTYTWLSIFSLYHHLRRGNGEYRPLISGNTTTGPIYTNA